MQDQWKGKFAFPIDHVGIMVKTENLPTLTQAIKLKPLFDYRDADDDKSILVFHEEHLPSGEERQCRKIHYLGVIDKIMEEM